MNTGKLKIGTCLKPSIEIKPGKWRMRNGQCAVVEYRSNAATPWPWTGYNFKTMEFSMWGDYGNSGDVGVWENDDLIEPCIDKPVVDWSKMPAWANWVAMEADGTWFYYSDKPQHHGDRFWLASEYICRIPKEFQPSFTGNWRDSLVERPVA